MTHGSLRNQVRGLWRGSRCVAQGREVLLVVSIAAGIAARRIRAVAEAAMQVVWPPVPADEQEGLDVVRPLHSVAYRRTSKAVPVVQEDPPGSGRGPGVPTVRQGPGATAEAHCRPSAGARCTTGRQSGRDVTTCPRCDVPGFYTASYLGLSSLEQAVLMTKFSLRQRRG